MSAASKLARLAAPLVLACVVSSVAAAQTEPFRPQFHFTPQRNWMNDPNGMVFLDGEWHLFYQYNPFGDTWGHMSWGHAVSRDLVRWTHLPLALAEEDGVMIYSGSAVVDWKNTSGYGKKGVPPLVAIYTGDHSGREDQRIAYSNDRGRTWTKVPEPVLDLQMADFRDPKVFWHARSSRWIMSVALPNEHVIQFYSSPNLREWTKVGAFGPSGATGGQWECPDLFPVSVEGGGTKWVLIVNINPGGITGGSGTQYFVGDFDGARFVAEPGDTTTRWADYGSDFYAGVSWNDVPRRDGRRVWMGWMSNWAYAKVVPTSPWRSAMTVPRALTLRRTPRGMRLVQTPVRELETLRRGPALHFDGGSLAGANAWLAAQRDLPPLLDVELGLAVTDSAPFDIRLVTGTDEQVVLHVDPARSELVVDRSRSGNAAFDPKFTLRHSAPLRIVNGDVNVRMLLDASSLEVFAQRGETVLTDLIFPTAGPRRLSLEASGRAPRVRAIDIHPLAAP
ncbi:MAG TPA: glycoside hydrolase family 32 protein [Gemmatimonadaceae bacterium]|jgi:fructan beta-fructosidase|nr:glycoside hydrolase family 32 protein [Gemmatimonadaceae bacterium]